MMRVTLVILVWGMLASGIARAAPVVEPVGDNLREGPSLERGVRSTGLGGGVSLGTRRYGGTLTHDQAVLQVHYGVVVSDLLAEERLLGGRVMLAGEFLFARQLRPDTAVLFGVSPLLRYIFETDATWKPFVEAGSGFALTDIGGPSLGGKLQFSPQAGAGLYWFVKPSTALVLQHRFIHYSNAGTRSPNAGINQHVFLVGVTRFY